MAQERDIVDRVLAEGFELFERIVHVNLKGPYLTCRAVIPHMLRDGGGAIVNIGSGAGLLGVPGHSGYVASKHAGIGLTRSAALEFAAKGIRVNAVCPGLVDTPLIHDPSTGELYDYITPLIAAHPIGRIAHASEVADAVVWLASSKASYVTGVALPSSMLSKYQSNPRFEAFRLQLWRVAALPPCTSATGPSSSRARCVCSPSCPRLAIPLEARRTPARNLA